MKAQIPFTGGAECGNICRKEKILSLLFF